MSLRIDTSSNPPSPKHKLRKDSRRPSVHQQILQSRQAAHHGEGHDPADLAVFQSPKHGNKKGIEREATAVREKPRFLIDTGMAEFLGMPSGSPVHKNNAKLLAKKQQSPKKRSSMGASSTRSNPGKFSA